MAAFIDHCEWNRPGADPYTGTPQAAIARYQGLLPETARAELLRKMNLGEVDMEVQIGRDSISGGFEPAIEFMHFADGRVCRSVDRSKWTAYETQPAYVYCSGDSCILVPHICGNISIVRRLPAAVLPPVVAVPEPEAEYAALSPSFATGATLPPPIGFGGFYGPGVPSGGGLPPAYPPGILAPVPEPSTWLLLVVGLAGVAVARWRRA